MIWYYKWYDITNYITLPYTLYCSIKNHDYEMSFGQTVIYLFWIVKICEQETVVYTGSF